jgi:hypothetical protein
MFQKSTADENELLKLVTNLFLPDHEVLQWRLVKGKDILTPNTNEIVVLSSSFPHGFGLPTYEFLCGLLHHYQIELVHFNPNPILHIPTFVHLCEAFLAVPPNFPLFKSYFFLKYQPNADNWKVIGGVGLQSHPYSGFLDLPMKMSLKGWHKSWFYYEKHEPSLPPFVDWLPEYQGTWAEEPTSIELPIIAALTKWVNDLKRRSMTRVCVVANWLAHQTMPLKKQVHPGWEYCQSGFMTLPSTPLQEQHVVVLCWRGLGSHKV